MDVAVLQLLVVDGYVRMCGGGALSAAATAIQRSQIVDWTARRGWRVGQILEEAPPICSATARPQLQRALGRVESGESDGIVITQLNQIGGTLEYALAAVERIQAAGGTFVSVRDGIDLSTPTGRLILRLLLSVREW